MCVSFRPLKYLGTLSFPKLDSIQVDEFSAQDPTQKCGKTKGDITDITPKRELPQFYLSLRSYYQIGETLRTSFSFRGKNFQDLF